MHAPIIIGAGIDTYDMSTWGDGKVCNIVETGWERIRDQQPGIVKGCVFSIELLALCLNVAKCVIRRWRAIQDREAITQQFALIDQRCLHLSTRTPRSSYNTDIVN